jgi:hypothetical protein
MHKFACSHNHCGLHLHVVYLGYHNIVGQPHVLVIHVSYHNTVGCLSGFFTSASTIVSIFSPTSSMVIPETSSTWCLEHKHLSELAW